MVIQDGVPGELVDVVLQQVRLDGHGARAAARRSGVRWGRTAGKVWPRLGGPKWVREWRGED